MTESLKARVGRVLTGSFHALLDRLEDQAPAAMMEQAIRDADVVIADVRLELGRSSANRHLAQQQHASLNQQHTTLAEQIDLALSQGREDLARAAIARQLDIEAQLPVLETTLADYVQQESELQAYVAALVAKQRDMQQSLDEFCKSRAAAAVTAGSPIANTATAQAQQRMDSIGRAFDRVHARQTGLGSGTAQSLHQAAQLQELEAIDRQHRIDQRLASLRRSD